MTGALLLALTAGCYSPPDGASTGAPNTSRGAFVVKGTRVHVIAHRGASAEAPENTLPAFQLAAEQGADWFELDCQLSADDEVVVIHDATLERTTDGTGRVADHTLAELRALDAGSWFDPRFAGTPIPTLAEALELTPGRHRIGAYVEIKSVADERALMEQVLARCQGHQRLEGALKAEVAALLDASGSRNVWLARRVIEVIGSSGAGEQVVIQSFSPIVCAVTRLEAPHLRTELLGFDDPKRPEIWEGYLRWLFLLDAAGFNVSVQSVREDRLAALSETGRTVAVWTVNDEAEMRRLIGLGVDRLITDRPALCRQVLEGLR